MSESIAGGLGLGLAAGFVLGGFYFLGLHFTVQRALRSARPALWFLGSTLVRTAAALAGFYLVSAGRWERMLACLLGFVVARRVVMLTTATREEPTLAP